jgi:WD40 repeat protein
VLAQLCLVRNIKGVKRTCRAFRDAAPEAEEAHRRVCLDLSGTVNCVQHTQWIICVAAAPDGRIITGSWDNTVKAWHDGVCERAFQGHTSVVDAVAVLQGGTHIVSGSYDGTVKLWTLDGAPERNFWVGNVSCVAALPDGVHFVVGLFSKEVRLYHVDGTLVNTFTGHTGRVYALAVTPDAQNLISGSQDKLVKVWSVATKSLVSTCFGHTDGVFAVAAMPDGKRILSGAFKQVRVWLLNGTLENTFRHLHTSTVKALVAMPDNQHALSGSVDKTVKLFNVNDGAVLRTFTHHTDRVCSLALLPDGRRFVSGSLDKTARIAYHGFVFEPDPAWVDAEKKAKAKAASSSSS